MARLIGPVGAVSRTRAISPLRARTSELRSLGARAPFLEQDFQRRLDGAAAPDEIGRSVQVDVRATRDQPRGTPRIPCTHELVQPPANHRVGVDVEPVELSSDHALS